MLRVSDVGYQICGTLSVVEPSAIRWWLCEEQCRRLDSPPVTNGSWASGAWGEKETRHGVSWRHSARLALSQVQPARASCPPVML